MVTARSVHVTEYNVSDGLPFVQVSAITQDADGYLWVGGYGGLSKFNGFTFKNYSKADGLAGSLVQSLHTDDSGTVWVGTSKGLNKLFNDSLVTLHRFAGKSILAIESSNEEIAILTPDSLFIVNTKTVVPVPTTVRLSGLLSLGGIIYVSSGKRIFTLDTSLGQLKPLEQDLPGTVNHLASDADGLLIAHSMGASLLSPIGNKRFDWTSGLLGFSVRNVFRDDSTHYWFATEIGLNLYNGKTFRLINLSDNPGSETINVFFRDREKNLWVGTQFGLFKLRQSAFKRFGFEDGLAASFIFQITEDSAGNLWIGTQKNGVYKKDASAFTRFGKEHGLSSNIAKTVCPVGDSVFIGTQSGLNIIYKNRISSYINLPLDGVNVLYKDDFNRLWVGGTGAVFLIEKNKTRLYPLPDSTIQVWSLKLAKNGDLLVGTYQGGLFKIPKNSSKLIEAEEAQGFENILAIEEDRFGNRYYGTFEGIYMHHPKTDSGVLFTESSGLNSKLIYTLLYIEEEHALWAGTNQGVNKLELSESGILKVTGFGEADGFSGVECNSHGTYRDQAGNLWFGTVNGLISMSTNSHFTNEIQNINHMTGILIDFKDTTLVNASTLDYQENNITFEFIGLCLTNPGKVEYKYRLVGFSDSWSPSTPVNRATYSNLPAGDYRFEVVSKNNSGIWSSNPTTFSFTVMAPFWERTWFLVAAAILLLLLISITGLAVVSKVRRDAKLQQRLDQLKLQALRAQMNPHFLFNSLNSIQYFITNNDTREANKFLSKFAKLMRLMLDNSRTSAVKLEDEVETLKLYLELESLRFEGKFNFEILVSPELKNTDPAIPPMLIQPFVENAILHGFTNIDYTGKITVSYSEEENHIVCEVADNGIGREASAKLQIQKAKKLHRSTGVHLISDRLATLNEYYKDKLSVSITDLFESGKPAGTKVLVHIPIIEKNTINQES